MKKIKLKPEHDVDVHRNREGKLQSISFSLNRDNKKLNHGETINLNVPEKCEMNFKVIGLKNINNGSVRVHVYPVSGMREL